MIEKQILVKNPRAIARGSLLVSHAKPTNVDYNVVTIIIALSEFPPAHNVVTLK
jgi:hypothetical protein